MEKYNTDITMCLKWLQNKAPGMQSIIEDKAAWYINNNDTFWQNWESDVFNIDTANAFGLFIWCIILGVPSELFDFTPSSKNWAFGNKRENFVFDKNHNATSPAHPTQPGGNFAGKQGSLSNLDEIRTMLKLRYVALVSNGRLIFINRMLKYIFGKGKPFDYPAGVYAYVIDGTVFDAKLDVATAKVYAQPAPPAWPYKPSINYVPYTDDLTRWSRTTTVLDISKASEVDPVYGEQAWRFKKLGSGGSAANYQGAVPSQVAATLKVGQLLTFSCSFKLVTPVTEVRVRFDPTVVTQPNGGTLPQVGFDLQNKKIIYYGNVANASITPQANGWFRCSCQIAIANVPTTQFGPMITLYGADGDTIDVAAPHLLLVEDTRQPYSANHGAWRGLELLSPAARTNFAPNAADASKWTGTTITPDANQFLLPDGKLGFCKFTFTAANSRLAFSPLNGAFAGKDCVISLMVKQADASSSVTLMAGPQSSVVGQQSVQFDIAQGTVLTSGATAGVEDYGNGWYRIWMLAHYSQSASSGWVNLAPIVAGQAVYAWGLQVEQAASLTKPAPTGLIRSGATATTTTDFTIAADGKITRNNPVTGEWLAWSGKWGVNHISEPTLVGQVVAGTTVYQIPVPAHTVPPVSKNNYMEYHVGPGITLSDAFVNILNERKYGIMPCNAGVEYKVIKEK